MDEGVNYSLVDVLVLFAKVAGILIFRGRCMFLFRI